MNRLEERLLRTRWLPDIAYYFLGGFWRDAKLWLTGHGWDGVKRCRHRSCCPRLPSYARVG